MGFSRVPIRVSGADRVKAPAGGCRLVRRSFVGCGCVIHQRLERSSTAPAFTLVTAGHALESNGLPSVPVIRRPGVRNHRGIPPPRRRRWRHSLAASPLPRLPAAGHCSGRGRTPCQGRPANVWPGGWRSAGTTARAYAGRGVADRRSPSVGLWICPLPAALSTEVHFQPVIRNFVSEKGHLGLSGFV
jgi:hypothetical protein